MNASLTKKCDLEHIELLNFPTRRPRVYTRNLLSPPDKYQYIQLAPGYVREILEIYDHWDGKDQIPSKLQDLMMVLRIEVDRRYKSQ